MNNKTIILFTVGLTTLMLLPVACVDKSDNKIDSQHFSAVLGTTYCGCAESQSAADDVGDSADYGTSCDELACGDQDDGNGGGVSCGSCSGHEYACIGQDGNGRNGHCAIPYLTVDTDGLRAYDGSPECGGPGQAACATAPDPGDPDQSPIFFCRGINLYLYDTESLSAYCDYLTPAIATGQSGCSYNSDCAGNGVCYGGTCQ